MSDSKTLRAATILTTLFATTALAQTTKPQPYNAVPWENVLYGVAYYNEYMPADLQPGRLDKDVALMKQAGISVVRMGESTWSLWEPEDGRFEYAWMDRVVDAMTKAGIKVIMGTPTYSIPTWLYHEHPEVLAEQLGGAKPFYGMRQNMDTDSPVYRFYSERLIRNLVEHYKNNPNVIGWQIDNETSSYGAANRDVFIGFVNHLKQKFGTTDNLNKAWFLNYWGEDVNSWEDMPTRDSASSTSYKLEWSRWSQMRVTNFLDWQAKLVRENRGPHQFVTTDFGGGMKSEVNEFEVAKALDIPAMNNYHGMQDHMDGESEAEAGDYTRSLKHSNYLITETNAQTTDWTSAYQYPPYDGQLRLDVYTHLSSGANMVEYWHWASIHAGQETYWKGVLSHDLEPNRAYAEVSKTAHELQKIGPHLVDLNIKNKVAILWSVDSLNAISFMPFTSNGPQWAFAPPIVGYGNLVHQMHRALYDLNIGTDFVFPENPDFSQYKVLIVPALYISDDALLQKISDFVKNGGHVLMTFKSGFANENSAVRWVRAPGPLREAAGFSYQEFSNLEKPLALKDDPYHVGADQSKVSYWAEFLMPEHAKALAYYDHPFFGKWPAITENNYGNGTLTYEGTYLSDTLQKAVVEQVLKEANLTGPDQQLPAPVHVKHGVNREGKQLHYYLNYSSNEQTFTYPYKAGTELLTGNAITSSGKITLQPWDVAIVEEK
ncbi:beta-galactosidase [Alloacidobacterium dinghuense]|uniref:Beta-galactosidase n=2 Tax=Alloacidobacterium dinghuense TaxID=2763107 RepID=A0A7G8BRA2_9BACT|nr:beta-galactosidase [Alloacidobacterium dinghuense]